MPIIGTSHYAARERFSTSIEAAAGRPLALVASNPNSTTIHPASAGIIHHADASDRSIARATSFDAFPFQSAFASPTSG